MKLIKNINIALSFGKGEGVVLFENSKEIIEFFPNTCKEMLSVIKIQEKDSKVLGFIKSHTWNPGEGDIEFIAVYKIEEENGDFKTLFKDARVYNGFLINVSSEADFIGKMVKIDKGQTEGFCLTNNF